MKKAIKHIISLFTLLFFGFLGTGCIFFDGLSFFTNSNLGLGVIISAFFLVVSVLFYVKILRKGKATMHNNA